MFMTSLYPRDFGVYFGSLDILGAKFSPGTYTLLFQKHKNFPRRGQLHEKHHHQQFSFSFCESAAKNGHPNCWKKMENFPNSCLQFDCFSLQSKCFNLESIFHSILKTEYSFIQFHCFLRSKSAGIEKNELPSIRTPRNNEETKQFGQEKNISIENFRFLRNATLSQKLKHIQFPETLEGKKKL